MSTKTKLTLEQIDFEADKFADFIYGLQATQKVRNEISRYGSEIVKAYLLELHGYTEELKAYCVDGE